ncbi:MAG: hypothetical protein M1832_006292 [Thelocarpon impressellum]|nr:MAG: hypothetical protein M1832_006292 [Thelocarpon impressellum]
MTDVHPPLNYRASASVTNHQASTGLPAEVVGCLKNARFLHLATCNALYPHVSLMNYTYLASSPYSSHPTIIMTTNPSSKKTFNLVGNPHVSLLVHDWVSHRPPTTTSTSTGRSTSPQPQGAGSSSLASLLQNLNSSALSSISTTINGEARLLEPDTAEEAYYKRVHLENNTFGEQARDEAPSGDGGAVGGRDDGGRGCFIEGEEVRVVAVKVRDGRIADWKGSVRDWSVVEAGEAGEAGEAVEAVEAHVSNGT